MTSPSDLARRLRNASVRELVSALERDGFSYRRSRGSSRVYRHSDGRRTVVHFHRANDTLPLGTIRSILTGTNWTEDDLARLGLI